jgi:RNA ligase
MRYHKPMAKMRTKEEAGLARSAEAGEVDMAEMRRLEADGYLSCNEHPTSSLLIWNYTQKAQFERLWTREILMSRGLITRPGGRVVARPFVKFFNFEEHHGPLPDGPYEVWEKVDGSLGILYRDDQGEPWIATRGSFASDQALRASEMIREPRYAARLDGLAHDFTHLFEIVYPENRVVVDYGREERLVYLGSVHTDQGWDVPPDASVWPDVPEFFATLASTDNPLDLKLLEAPNKEGFVLRYTGPGLRLKVKFDDYVRLHRAITELTARTVWDIIRHQGEGEVWRFMDNTPDEYYSWAQGIVAGLTAAVEEKLAAAEGSLGDGLAAVGRGNRGELARWMKANSAEFDLAMGMLDGKDYRTVGATPRDRLWARVRPKATRPFGELEMFDDEGKE